MGDREALAVAPDAVAKLLKQGEEFIETAVDVADDVERPRIVAAVGPQAAAHDLDVVDLVLRVELEPVPEALPTEALDRAAQRAHVVAHDMRPEIAVRSRGIALVTDAFRQIEHDRHG